MNKNLDEELAEAAGLDEEGSASDSGPGAEHGEAAMAVPQPPQLHSDDEAGSAASRAGRGLLVMLLVMVAGIVSLFLFAFKPAAIYSMPLEQLLAAAEDNTGRRVRIEGELVPGTLVKRDSPCEFRFSMRGTEARDQKISVRFPQCIVPDTFRDVPEGGVMVTAEGTLGEDGSFEATHIMAKCSSKYNAETHAMEGPTDSAVAPPADPYE